MDNDGRDGTDGAAALPEKRDVNFGFHQFTEGVTRYASGEREQLEWFWGYLIDELKQSREAAADALKMEWSEIYQVMTGAAKPELLEGCLEAIARLRKLEAANRTRLAETSVTRHIVEALNYAKEFCAMVSITGPTGRSKTFTAKHWARENNHGRSIYVRCPSAATRRSFVTALCRARGLNAQKKTTELEDRLFRAITARNVLILDEAGHLLPRSGRGTGAIELVRDLHDICGCAVALIFTDVYLDDMRNGAMADYYEQFRGRLKYEVSIPPLVRKDEVKAAVSVFRKSPPEKLLDFALRLARERDGRLRTLFEDLQRAKEFAQAEGREMNVEDLKVASDWRKSGKTYADEE